MLPDEGLVPHSDRYCHRRQTLNYHYYLARENLLHLDSMTNVVLARYQPGSTLLLLVEYPDAGRATTAAESFRQTFLSGATTNEPQLRANSKFALCEQVNRYLIVVLESPAAESARSLGELAKTRLTEFLSRGK